MTANAATSRHVIENDCAWIDRAAVTLRGLVCAALVGFVLQTAAANAQGATPTKGDQAPLNAGQLEQLVAPIALYPDDLLSQVLMASTYPLEVVQAARWAGQNPGVTGRPLEDAMAKQPWDSSIKGLVAVPQTLQMMSEKLEWTRRLGDSFLVQQQDLMDAVQRLRQRADAAGNLTTTPQQTVSRVSQPGPSGQPLERIVVERADPQTVYVPVYDPAVAFGTWPYQEYPPDYWTPPGYVPGAVLAGALGFTAAAVVGNAIWGRADWWRGNVGINPLRYNSFNRTNISNVNWNHNPAHRGNVAYRDRATSERFGGANAPGGARANVRPGQTGAGSKQIGQGAGARGKQAGQGARQNAGAGSPGKGGGQKAAQAKGGQRAAQKSGQQRAAQAKGSGKQAARSSASSRPAAGNRPTAHRPSATRSASLPRSGGGIYRAAGGGRMHAGGELGRHAMGGGGMRGGGAMRGGGRRSDIRLKHDIVFLGHLDNGLGFYRFRYNGSERAYVGVMAQEVQSVRPDTVSRDRDGMLRVRYQALGVKFQTYNEWLESGARVPAAVRTD
jgi:hypothetical protein